MGRTYNIIDSDGHVLEPQHFWREYIDPHYRDRAPDLIVDDNGNERLLIEGKLFGVAMLPMQSIELAVEEMCYARNELGMRAGFLRPNPYNNRMLGDPDYDIFWAEAQELDFRSVFMRERVGCQPSAWIAFRVLARGTWSHTLWK